MVAQPSPNHTRQPTPRFAHTIVSATSELGLKRVRERVALSPFVCLGPSQSSYWGEGLAINRQVVLFSHVRPPRYFYSHLEVPHDPVKFDLVCAQIDSETGVLR